MDKTIYIDSINKIYNSIIWTHKIQRTYLEYLESKRKNCEIIKIVFTALSSISTSIFAFMSNNVGTIISALLTLFSVFFGEILEKIETKNDIQLFKDSSTKLFEMRNEMIILADKIKSEQITDTIVELQINVINEKYTSLQRNLPTVPNRFVDLASSKINERKDEEVDTKLL